MNIGMSLAWSGVRCNHSVMPRVLPGTQLCAALLTMTQCSVTAANIEINSRFARATIAPQGATLVDVVAAGHATDLLLSADEARPFNGHGHFLCFDRWGRISAAEQARGHVFHGEARHQHWQVLAAKPNRVTLRTTLPASRLAVERAYEVSPVAPVLTITSVAINDTDRSRPYNLVEHALLAPMWLGVKVRLHTNARAGHLHLAGLPVPGSAFTWPRAITPEGPQDLRGNFRSEPDVIASVVFPADDSHAWVLLHDAETATAFAMVWPRIDLPWLNLWWRGSHASKPARAIEPGTTGLHRPIEECIERGQLLDNPLLVELQPGESRRHRLHYVLLPKLADGAEFWGAEVTDGVFHVRWQTARGRVEQLMALPADA
jgi:hypothetical protein